MDNLTQNEFEYDWVREMARKSLGSEYESCKEYVENFIVDYDKTLTTMQIMMNEDVKSFVMPK